jgi:molybdopterin converting factor small subunit
MKQSTINTMIDAGATRWTKNGKNRLYLNESSEKIIGIEGTFRKNGALSFATLKGETISNAEAGRIYTCIGKAYIDLDTDEIVMGSTLREKYGVTDETLRNEIAAYISGLEKDVEEETGEVASTEEKKFYLYINGECMSTDSTREEAIGSVEQYAEMSAADAARAVDDADEIGSVTNTSGRMLHPYDFPGVRVWTEGVSAPSISARIKTARGQLTQMMAAAKVEVPLRTWQNWEQGVRTPPEYTVHMIEKILKPS